MAIKGLQGWLDKFSRLEMPVLANVINEPSELAGNDDAEVDQLSNVILRDPHLTSQVLRIASSIQYNPSGKPINTISRAVVLIGFTGVRAICISSMVIESLLGKQPKGQLMEIMAQSFHAAVQAQNLAENCDDNTREEVFIAALLFHVGEMAFWSCGGDQRDELIARLEEGASLREASTEVLGASMKAITNGLAGLWNLGDTLEEALYPPQQTTQKVIAVRLGDQLSRAVKDGWTSPEVGKIIAKMAKFSGVGFDVMKQRALDGADEAAQVATEYGASKICHLIPSRTMSDKPSEAEARSGQMEANPELQLNILKDLTEALAEQVDVNSIFQMVIEGMHRGIGLERVTVAFIQQDRAKARYVLGEGTDSWRDRFDFDVGRFSENILSYAIGKRQPVWIKDQTIKKLKYHYPPEMVKVLGKFPAFISVVSIGPRHVAVFYADRWDLGGLLNATQFDSFKHFVTQAQLALQVLSKQKARA